ncbi:MAG: ComEC family competence protein, partial [Calditrichaeota bacterium]
MSALKTNLNTLWQQVPLAPVFLALAGGICAADRVQLNPLWLMLPGIGLLFISVLRGLGKGREPTLPLLLVTFFLAAASFSLWRQVHFPRWLDGLLQTRTIDLTGQVVALRQAPPFLAELEIDSVNQRPLPGGAQLRFQFRPHAQGTLPFQEGQRLRLKQVKLTPLSAPRNPGAFNYRRYLKLRGISARLEAGRQSSWEVIAPSRHTLLERCTGLIRRARQALGTRLDRLLSPEASAFYRALLLGQREFLSRSLLRDYQNAGVIHVLAISGLHVGFLAVIFYLALSFLPLSFKKRNLCVILLLLVYMVLVGSRPPVVRATVMAGLILLAQNLERKHSTLNAFFAAGCLILVFAPAQLFWVGFQLSFAAVAAILIGLPLLERRLLYRWLE